MCSTFGYFCIMTKVVNLDEDIGGHFRLFLTMANIDNIDANLGGYISFFK